FTLFGAEGAKRGSVRVRPGQQRFRFQVLKEYRPKCAVCSISHSLLLHAAHLCGKAAKGSDDWRNGLPLCATHHLAFDANLFAIVPTRLKSCCHWVGSRYPRCPRNISDNKGTTAPRCPAMAIRAVQQRTAPRTKFRDRSGGFSLATRDAKLGRFLRLALEQRTFQVPHGRLNFPSFDL